MPGNVDASCLRLFNTRHVTISAIPMEPALPLRQLPAPDAADIGALARLLADCVADGASVSFMHPLPLDRARAFWQQVAQGVVRGERLLLAADDAEGVCGTVQLVLAQPENQPHRADLAKMLVHPRARRRGVGAALLAAAEQAARDHGKTLLVLDTASAEAARLYARAGWVACGTVPGYALLPHGGLCATTFFYKALAAP
jgi:GNAT superfamily N-acetyltransferase